MTEVPAELFADALHQLIMLLREFLPGNPGQSLYLRPTLLGVDEHFGVQGSDNFTFLLMASPSDPYYAEPIKVLIEREQCRAALPGALEPQ